MVRPLGLVVVAASGSLLCGCAGTTVLGHRQARPAQRSTTATAPAGSSSHERADYLRALGRGQAKLAAAERAIPRRPGTPAQLSRSIGLLASAIRRLGGDLDAIEPPAEVASAHARLVSIVRAYAVALERAGHVAVGPRGELRAGNMLISATTTASSAFASTVAMIDAALRR
jgi:hypothetical protein